MFVTKQFDLSSCKGSYLKVHNTRSWQTIITCYSIVIEYCNIFKLIPTTHTQCHAQLSNSEETLQITKI